MTRSLLVLLATLCAATPAQAAEVFGGLYVHDIHSPLTLGGEEGGVDAQLGYRFGRIGRTPLQPYVFGALNSDGETHYAVVGISAKFGKRLYVRPGVGLAIHSGDSGEFEDHSTTTSSSATGSCSRRKSVSVIRSTTG